MPTILTASWSARLPGGTTAVGISRGTPRGRGGFRRLPALFPGPWFRSVAPETYLRRYAEILAPLGPRRGVACSWREVAADNANYRSQRRDQAPDRSETRHPPLAEPPADELALALKFARAEKSEATRRAYRSDFRIFKKWSEARKTRCAPGNPGCPRRFPRL
jgi:hypothetical protein